MENHGTAVSVVKETLPLDPISESDRVETSVAQICRSRGSNVPVFFELRRHSRISPRLEPTPILEDEITRTSEHQKKVVHSKHRGSIIMSGIVSADPHWLNRRVLSQISPDPLVMSDPLYTVNIVAGINELPNIQKHALVIIQEIQRGNASAIEVGLSLNQFLIWMAQNDYDVVFGPRLIGNLNRKIPGFPRINIKGGTSDCIAIRLKGDIPPRQREEVLHLLHRIRILGERKTGEYAYTLLAYCSQVEIAQVIESFEVLEFKLGNHYTQSKRELHHSQLSHYIGVLLTKSEEEIDRTLRGSTLQPVLFHLLPYNIPSVKGMVIYFHSSGVECDAVEAKRFVLTEDIALQIVKAEQARRAVALKRERTLIRGELTPALMVMRQQQKLEAYFNEADIIAGHFRRGLLTETELFKLLNEQEDPFAENIVLIEDIIGRIQKGEIFIRIDEIITIAGQIGIVWQFSDGTLAIPLFERQLDKDVMLIIPPDQSTVIVVTESWLREVLFTEIPIVNYQGNVVSRDSLVLLLRAAVRDGISKDFCSPFTLRGLPPDEMDARLSTFDHLFIGNFISGGDWSCRRAREYVETRGIPLDIAQKYGVICTAKAPSDLKRCVFNGMSLAGKEASELRLLMGMACGNIWTGIRTLLGGAMVGFTVRNPFDPENKAKGFAFRVIRNKRPEQKQEASTDDTSKAKKKELKHLCFIPPLIRQDGEMYKIVLGDLNSSDIAVICEGVFDSLSVMYLLEDLGGMDSGHVCVIGNIGVNVYDINDLIKKIREQYPTKVILIALDRDNAGQTATDKLDDKELIYFWGLFEVFLRENFLGGPLPPPSELKDLNDLLLYMLAHYPLLLVQYFMRTFKEMLISRRYHVFQNVSEP